MATNVATQYASPAGALSARLERLEELVEEPVPANVEALLVLLDDTQAELVNLERSNLEVGEERLHWNSLLEDLEKRPQLISVPARGVPGGMNALRAKHPPATAFWWQADRLRAAHLRSQLLRAILLLLVAAAVVWGAAWLWSYLAPDDAESAAARAVTLEWARRQ